MPIALAQQIYNNNQQEDYYCGETAYECNQQTYKKPVQSSNGLVRLLNCPIGSLKARLDSPVKAIES